MSIYYPEPSGGVVTRASHVGGANAHVFNIEGSQYPATSAMHGHRGNQGYAFSEMGHKLYPFQGHHILGKPLFARSTGGSLSYTPPT